MFRTQLRLQTTPRAGIGYGGLYLLPGELGRAENKWEEADLTRDRSSKNMERKGERIPYRRRVDKVEGIGRIGKDLTGHLVVDSAVSSKSGGRVACG